MSPPDSIDGVVHVELLRGPKASARATPSLLVEVPHGADRRHHYDALATKLTGELPADLHEFFSVNTDVGAWDFGRAVAERVLQAEPATSAVLVRSLIPRTLIDCNRPADYAGGDLSKGAITAGIPSYIEDAADRALLMDLHRQYVDVATRAYDLVCGGGGLAFNPHTYGPRSLGIARVDRDIVKNLQWACAPERHDTWPLRAEVDLLTRDGEGKLYAPAGAEERLLADLAAAGFSPKANDTYHLTPGSMGYAFAVTHPGRVVCLEVRRDLLVDWDPLVEMIPLPARVAKIADVVAPALTATLRTLSSSKENTA